MEKPLRVEDIPTPPTPKPPSSTAPLKLGKTSKGIENAKKRLRAFSIQKKTTVPAVPAAPTKPATTGCNTVVIGKLSSVKTTPKPAPENDEQKKPQKPPKPGTTKKLFQETYSELQKKTLAEIEDMKRKMELVDLGIPLGLICPTPDSDKAMPTKAMPPIKTFLEPAKVDELIREAKKARAEGRAFKFDYNKLLPDYDNPFQRKRDDQALDKERKIDKLEQHKNDKDRHRDRKTDRHDSRRYSSHRRDKDSKDKSRSRENKNKDRVEKVHKAKENDIEREADVNLSDYLVCDSWSLDNDEKNSSSPHVTEEKISKSGEAHKRTKTTVDVMKQSDKEDLSKSNDPMSKSNETSAKNINPLLREYTRLEKLRPVNDSFEFEIDPNEETLDIINKDSKIKKSPKPVGDKIRIYDCDSNSARDSSFEDINDETFLESVINEIKQEDLSDVSQDKALVEYDDSPKDDEISLKESQGSVTPELNDSVRSQSSHRSDFSGYRSTESGYKSTESGYKSTESGYKLTGSECRSLASSQSSDSYQTIEKETETFECDMSKSTVESLELWTFVLKICQPLLFRHDKNKCYKETHSFPKLWYTENPKMCNCVKDRAVVYDELEIFKPDIVDRIYGQYQNFKETVPTDRTWYPHMNVFLSDMVQLSSEWEMEDSQIEIEESELKRTLTPQQSEALTLDREYQRFMDAVWPEISESKKETSRSTTPVQESRKKKIVEIEKNLEESKKSKKMKSGSEGWSQESDEGEKSVKKPKVEKEKKILKRRHSTSTLSTASDDEVEVKRKKKTDKRANKKQKFKSSKGSRNEKRKLKKLKEKDRKKKKHLKSEKNNENTDDAEESKKKERRKLKKKKQQKLKRKILKKKAKKTSSSSDVSSSSTESSSESESEPEIKLKKSKKKNSEARKIRKEKRRQRKQSTDSNQELFDVNILNNIKTERLTDDEKSQKKLTDQDFSPRRQQKKRQEIINVKELQDDFVGNNIHVKQEKEDLGENNVENKIKNNEQTVTVANDEKAVTLAKNEKTATIVSNKITSEIENTEITSPRSVSIETAVEEKDSVMELLIEDLNEKKSDPESNERKSESKVEEYADPEKSVEEIKIQENVDAESKPEYMNFKEPQSTSVSNFKNIVEESNLSQCSSQESVISVKDMPIYEKDDSHLRPSSQNSNYSFNDVISASQSGIYHKGKESSVVCDEKFIELYEPQNYEMYEQMAMAYQNDVANQQGYSVPPVMAPVGEHRIETVVGSRNRGEIKCDWRPGDTPTSLHPQRPSRWGLKPGEVNIVLTGGNSEQFPIRSVAEPVYRIESIANRNDTGTGYDEAYMDMYGASDRLQYGDCFATDNESSSFNLDSSAFSLTTIDSSNTADNDRLQTDSTKMQRNSAIKDIIKNTKRNERIEVPKITNNSKNLNNTKISNETDTASISDNKVSFEKSKKEDVNRASLEARIDQALKHTVLGEVAKEPECVDVDNDVPEKGILITTLDSNRVSKRVSFADGYKPGQDSDVEEPPVKKKKKKVRRVGCPWPCPANHPDHVPLWDALPPPPPPPGSPPPPPAPRAPPTHLLRRAPPPSILPTPPHAMMHKFDPNSLPNMMAAEPPSGLIGFP